MVNSKKKQRVNSAKKSTVIVNGDSDDDDDFVVKENKFQDEENRNWQNLDNDPRKKTNDEDQDGNHGALVKKILESKEQLEYGNELNRNKDLVNLYFISICFLFLILFY